MRGLARFGKFMSIKEIEIKINRAIKNHKKWQFNANLSIKDYLDSLSSYWVRNGLVKEEYEIIKQSVINYGKWADRREERIENYCHSLLKDFLYNQITILSFLRDEDKEKIEELYEKVTDMCDFVPEDYGTYGEDELRDLVERIELFTKHIVDFRAWDFSFNVEVFTDTLKLTGKHLMKSDITVGGFKSGKKCLFAAEWLSKAMTEDLPNEHMKRWHRMYDKYRVSKCWDKEGNRIFSSEISEECKCPKAVKKLMDEAFSKGTEEAEKEKKEAWSYLVKHIEGWWD